MRLGLLVGAAVLVAAFLSIVPGARARGSPALGGATLYAYLLHGFFTKFIEYMGWFDAPFLHTVPGVIAVAAWRRRCSRRCCAHRRCARSCTGRWSRTCPGRSSRCAVPEKA